MKYLLIVYFLLSALFIQYDLNQINKELLRIKNKNEILKTQFDNYKIKQITPKLDSLITINELMTRKNTRNLIVKYIELKNNFECIHVPNLNHYKYKFNKIDNLINQFLIEKQISKKKIIIQLSLFVIWILILVVHKMLEIIWKSV